MDWIHCNSCYVQRPGPGEEFLLTSCGHIICSNCVVRRAPRDGTCLICGSGCSTMAISASMKPQLKIYFEDLGDLMKKQRKTLTEVYDFQKSHRERLQSHAKKVQGTRLALEARLEELQQKNGELKMEVSHLRTKCSLGD
eukprot:m.187673 g.187673  ORF g.187673 m.187673 type:complete len:140 (+) comp39366_c0_seq20:85-504(+)